MLRTTTVNEGGRQLLVVEEVIKVLDGSDGVTEDHGQSRLHAGEQVIGGLLLGITLHPNDILLHVLVGRACATHTDTNVVLRHILASQATSLFGKSGAEHHVNMVGILVGVWELSQNPLKLTRMWSQTSSAHDLAELSLPVGLEHLVSLIDDGKPVERNG